MSSAYEQGKTHGLIEKNTYSKADIKKRRAELESSVENCKSAQSKDYIRGLLSGLR